MPGWRSSAGEAALSAASQLTPMRHDGDMDSGPGVLPGGPAHPARTRLDGRQRWIAGALVAQLLLVSGYVTVLTSDLPPIEIAASVALLLAFSGVYVLGVGRVVDAPMPHRIVVLAVLFALGLPQFLVMGSAASALWIFLAVAGGILLRPIAAIGLGACLAAAMLVIDAAVGDPIGWELALTLLAMTLFMVGFAGNIRLTIALRETREQLARAAVAAERERIGRDLHDILGHSLTAVAVKAGLARRLMDRDPAAAAVEIADVELLVREALADVRATASGFREVSLGSELAVSASVLRAAGIAAVLPHSVDTVDPAGHELFGFVVREAVTNVVRHSGASTCTVTVGANWVQIHDDGIGACPSRGDDGIGACPSRGDDGNGLQGLRARLAAVGGQVQAGPAVGGGFTVRADIPAGTPSTPAARAARAVA